MLAVEKSFLVALLLLFSALCYELAEVWCVSGGFCVVYYGVYPTVLAAVVLRLLLAYSTLDSFRLYAVQRGRPVPVL